jgi:hypothetical protein
MPIAPQTITATNPNPLTYQFSDDRQAGLPFIIPTDAVVTECTNNRIVTVQETPDGQRVAVLGPIAYEPDEYTTYAIINWGVLELALQSNGIDSIAPSPRTFKDGDTVTVLTGLSRVYMIDYEADHKPDVGIATARVDLQGRLTDRAADATHIQLGGSVFDSNIGAQMSNQKLPGTMYYKLKDNVLG